EHTLRGRQSIVGVCRAIHPVIEVEDAKGQNWSVREINGVLHPGLGAHDERSPVTNLGRCGRDGLTDELVNTGVGNGCLPLKHDFVQIWFSGDPVASTLEAHIPERALECVPHVLNLAARKPRATNPEQYM